MMDWSDLDWPALERLRARFLEGRPNRPDYWQSLSDVASYDLTYAQRIGWKWDYVLTELQNRGWTPPAGELFDWGCGSGIAGRAFLDRFRSERGSGLALWDRSPLAREFARRKASERFPEVPIRVALPEQVRPTVILLSHVLNELGPREVESLLAWATQAQVILWVEPGTSDVSRRLIAIREELRASFSLVGPCPHQGPCGLLSAGNEAHWCHHFARPPSEVFTDSNWVRFAAMAGIDLRSLPLSFLVMDQRPGETAGAVDRCRILGRPRLQKAQAILFTCSAEELRERSISQRSAPEFFRKLKKGRWDPFDLNALGGL